MTTENENNTQEASSSAATGSSPSWSETWDDEDNSVWEAAGPYTDEGGSSEFQWRLRQRLRDNKVEWVEDSDAELMMDEEDPRTWTSIGEAKAAMAQDHSDILATCAAEAGKAQNDKLTDRGENNQ